MEKIQELTWWWRAGVGYQKVTFLDSKDCDESKVKITDCKTEWYSIYLRWARSLRQNTSQRGKKLKHLSQFSEQESEKYPNNIKKQDLLTIIV